MIDAFLDAIEQVLRLFHQLAEPVTGAAAWGWAIVLLTVAVRVVLLPLAIKQTNSMRAMQQLQPEIKKIQAKHKVDRALMRSDPEKYRKKRQEQQEAMMALYKEHNVNPAAGCLPLVLQMPIFLALFNVLNNRARVPELDTPFYLIDSLAERASVAGVGGWLLIVLMAATTYYSQKQMMASNPGAMGQNPQQQVMLYAMPVLLTFFAFNIPVGVLLYWVTTNVWTIGQQYVMFRTAGAAGQVARVEAERARERR